MQIVLLPGGVSLNLYSVGFFLEKFKKKSMLFYPSQLRPCQDSIWLVRCNFSSFRNHNLMSNSFTTLAGSESICHF